MSTEKKEMPHPDHAIEEAERDDRRDHAPQAAEAEDGAYTFTDWASI